VFVSGSTDQSQFSSSSINSRDFTITLHYFNMDHYATVNKESALPPPAKRDRPRKNVPVLLLPYDVELLSSRFDKFGRNKFAFCNKNVFLPDITYKYFHENLCLKLNASTPLDCFFTCNGSLTIFNFSNDDVDLLNQLLRYLVKSLGINKYEAEEVEKDVTQYLHVDCLSSYWDSTCQRLNSLPSSAFTSKIMIKIMGLVLYKKRQSDVMMVKLLYYVDQVKVIRVLNSTTNVKCAFD
jgi:hypothetical protein